MYETWITKDGRSILVSKMTDLHLLNTITALRENRMYRDQPDEREKNLIILQAEAIKRGLDYKTPPIYKISLIDWLANESHHYELCQVWNKYQMPEMIMDIERKSRLPVYLHWIIKPNEGTPLAEPEPKVKCGFGYEAR